MEQQSILNFNQAINAIKSAILKSRFRMATLANRELLFTAPEDRFPTGTNLPTNLSLTKVE